MKKILISLTMVFGIIVMVNGQELTSKKGFTILPETGDYVIGFNAVPVVDFFLNAADIMTNAGTTAQHPGYVTGFNNVLVGKYFLEDTKAIRGKLAINTGSMTTKTFFDDPFDITANPTDPTQWGELEDVNKIGGSTIILGGGLEFRRGHNRVQGFYGGELLLGFASNSIHNTWSVEMNNESMTNGYTNGDGSALNGRIIDQKSGMAITFGLRGFAGIEYFFAPKISIAAEFGWGFGMTTNPRGSVTVETWDAAAVASEEETFEGTNSGSSMGFQVDDGIGQTLMPSAALMMYFHF
ncbi:MAG: hypothetical protein AB7V36_07865 [Bacteroidales bacterium]|jgi:hypothetical protein|nr:hypothetical protein [Bacteroidales bacterium]HPF00925.1 hypothetical protein [Bacteroidales bacterium]